MHQHSLYGEIISQQGVRSDPRKVEGPTDMPSPKSFKELLSFLAKINYLSEFSPETSEGCEPL